MSPDDYWRLAPIECQRIAKAWRYNIDLHRDMHRRTQVMVYNSVAKTPIRDFAEFWRLEMDPTREEMLESRNEGLKKWTKEELLERVKN